MRYLFFILLLLSQLAEAQLKSPFRRYTFDNTLIDSTLSGSNLTAYGDATFDASLKAVGSHSGIMDGGNDYWRIPISDFGDNFFVSLWLRSDASITSERVFFTEADASNYFYLYVTTTDVIRAKVTGGNTAGNGTWTATTWHNLVYVFRKSDGRCRIYMDGARVAHADSTVETSFNSADSCFIGVDYYRNGDWDGNVDEVIIGKWIPTEAQIDSLYDLSYMEESPPPSYDPPEFHVFLAEAEQKPFLSEAIQYFLTSTRTPIQSILAGFTEKYVLACKQKYAIPEDVNDDDYVGVWQKTWSWQGGGTYTFTIETNFNNAFKITKTGASTALIQIADATQIDGKIIQQDTTINLIIRTTDSDFGFELDTAEVWVKENSYCRFYDFAGAGAGTRANPFNDLDDEAFVAGRGYFLARGSYINGETTSLSNLDASTAHPTIIAAYGSGNKPFFNGSGLGTGINNRCFVVGEYTGANPCDNIFFYDLKVRGYYSDAFYIWRPSSYLGLYNIELYNNCQDYSGESSITYRTSTYADSAVVAPIEIINMNADSTQEIYGGPSYNGVAFFKIGAGPARVINSRFGRSKYDAIRFTCGRSHVLQYCLIQSGSTSTAGWCSAIQFRGDNGLIEANRIIGNYNGLYVTAPGGGAGWTYELMPDSITIRQNYFEGQFGRAIDISNGDVNYNVSVGNTIEDNYMENNYSGIFFRDTRNMSISRNTLSETNGQYGIQGSGTETSSGLSITYNLIYGFLTDEIYIPLSSGMTIYNNTVYGSLALTGSTSPTVRNNLYGSSTVSTSNNVDLDEIDPDDYFVDYVTGDYHLKPTALDAIDQGTDVGLSYDIEGTEVPKGATFDIGAYEYVP